MCDLKYDLKMCVCILLNVFFQDYILVCVCCLCELGHKAERPRKGREEGRKKEREKRRNGKKIWKRRMVG